VDYDEFLIAVTDRTALSRDQAEAITRATLEVLADRLSGGEAQDLAKELPAPLSDWLSERTPDEQAKPWSVQSFLRRVEDVAGVPADVAIAGVQAVFAALREAVPDREWRHLAGQLPEEYEELVPGA
jgi:uncharacterized protein (DUF2267 family)